MTTATAKNRADKIRCSSTPDLFAKPKRKGKAK